MKHLLITTIAAVVLVGCGPSVGIHQAAYDGDIQVVKYHLADGADVNAKDDIFGTPLDSANALIKFQNAFPPALSRSLNETAALLRKHGGKTGEALKAEGK